jgi:hypothetical protein
VLTSGANVAAGSSIGNFVVNTLYLTLGNLVSIICILISAFLEAFFHILFRGTNSGHIFLG